MQRSQSLILSIFGRHEVTILTSNKGVKLPDYKQQKARFRGLLN